MTKNGVVKYTTVLRIGNKLRWKYNLRMSIYESIGYFQFLTLFCMYRTTINL